MEVETITLPQGKNNVNPKLSSYIHKTETNDTIINKSSLIEETTIMQSEQNTFQPTEEEYISELTNTKSDSNEINRENSPPMEIENNKGENSNISFPINQEMLDHLQNIEENLKISDETDPQCEVLHETLEEEESGETVSIKSDPQSNADNENSNSCSIRSFEITRNNKKKAEEKMTPKKTSPSKSNEKDLDNVDTDGKFKIPNKELTKEELQARYKNIIYTVDEEDIPCTLCLEDLIFDDDDQIVMCDLCNSGFHQSCYGGELLGANLEELPGDWFCQRCNYLIQNDLPFDSIRCHFCPEMKGPMKKIKEDNDKDWAHMFCVNWIPEIYYTDDKLKINVFIEKYWENKSCGRKNLHCKYCKIPYGDCIQCDERSCSLAFHVTCAVKHGLIARWEDMKELRRANDDEYFNPLFCKAHMREKNRDMYENSRKTEKKNLDNLENYSFMIGTPTLSSMEIKTRPLVSIKKKIRGPYKTEKKARLLTSPENNSSSLAKRKRGRPKKDSYPVIIDLELVEENLYKLSAEKEPVSAFKESSETKKNKKSSEKEEKKEKENEEEQKMDEENKQERKEKSEKKQSSEKKAGRIKKLSALTKSLEINTSITEKNSSMEIERREKKENHTKLTTQKEIKNITPKENKKDVSIPKENKKDMPTPKENKNLPTPKERKDVQENKEAPKLHKPPVKPVNGTKKEESKETKDVLELYKFKQAMARLMNFDSWVEEKKIKKVISDYIKDKGIYDRQKAELDLSKDPELKNLLGVSRIPREKIFENFMVCIFKKTATMTSIFAKQQQHSQKEADTEEEKIIKKIKPNPTPSETPKSNEKQNGKKDEPLLQKQKSAGKENINTEIIPIEQANKVNKTEQTNSMQIEEPSLNRKKSEPAQIQTNGELKLRKSSSHLEQEHKKKNSNKPTSSLYNNHINSSAFLQSILGGNDKPSKPENPQKREDAFGGLTALISRPDQVSFRKNMNWFMKPRMEPGMEPLQDIFSATVKQVLWPKGAELLY